MPHIAPVKPLLAVIIHLSSKCYTWWESTIAQSGECANAWDFVNVSYKKYITLLWGLCSCQGQQDLIEKGVSVRRCEISVSPRSWNWASDKSKSSEFERLLSDNIYSVHARGLGRRLVKHPVLFSCFKIRVHLSQVSGLTDSRTVKQLFTEVNLIQC